MEETNIITLTGENDEKFDFEIADSFELDGNKYIALIPPEDEETEEDEVLIMRIESEEEDETVLTQIEDDEELDKAFEMFRDRCADLFDFAD